MTDSENKLPTALTVVIATVKFNKNEVLIRIGSTPPNRFSFDRSLIAPFLPYVVTPIIGLLIAYFPPLGRILFSWMNVFSGVVGSLVDEVPAAGCREPQHLKELTTPSRISRDERCGSA